MLELRHIYFMSSWSFNIMGIETSMLRQQSEEYNKAYAATKNKTKTKTKTKIRGKYNE